MPTIRSEGGRPRGWCRIETLLEMVRSARTACGRPRRSNRYTNNRHTTNLRYRPRLSYGGYQSSRHTALFHIHLELPDQSRRRQRYDNGASCFKRYESDALFFPDGLHPAKGRHCGSETVRLAHRQAAIEPEQEESPRLGSIMKPHRPRKPSS